MVATATIVVEVPLIGDALGAVELLGGEEEYVAAFGGDRGVGDAVAAEIAAELAVVAPGIGQDAAAAVQEILQSEYFQERRDFAFPFGDECKGRPCFLFAGFGPHVEGGTAMLGVFGGEVFFGGEVDLGAVGGHANVVDVVSAGDVVGDGVIDAHVEVGGLEGTADGRVINRSTRWRGTGGEAARAGAAGGDEDVGAVGGDGGDLEGIAGVIGGLGGNRFAAGELGGDLDASVPVSSS